MLIWEIYGCTQKGPIILSVGGESIICSRYSGGMGGKEGRHMILR